MGMISDAGLLSFGFTEVLESAIVRVAICVLAVLVGLRILRKLWNWLRRPPGDERSTPIIRLESHPTKPVRFPVYVRNLPSRLAAVVVAPLSGSTQVPSVGQIPRLVDKFVPGLSKAIEEHDPIVKDWPRQFSTQGFGHSLVRYVQIPDDEWRGSRWCLVCGPGFLGEQRYVIGFVIAFDSPNSMDLVRVESDSEWTSLVHVADSENDP